MKIVFSRKRHKQRNKILLTKKKLFLYDFSLLLFSSPAATKQQQPHFTSQNKWGKYNEKPQEIMEKKIDRISIQLISSLIGHENISPQ
jgi:hypothetical protein